MIVFVHIERSGGAKINQALLPYFPERSVIFTGLVDVPEALARTTCAADRRWFLGGHVRFSQLGPFIETRQPGDVLFSTTRDPLERAVSLFYLALRSPTWLPMLAPIAQTKGFADFYAAAVDAGMLRANAQCVHLSGSPDWRQTLATVQHHYDLVGTYSRYKQLLDGLQTLLSPQIAGLHIDDERINAAYHDGSDATGWTQRQSIETLVDRPTRARIEREHDQDYALIEHIEAQADGVLRRDTPISYAQGVPIT